VLLCCCAGSICQMKRNRHVFIPEQQFRLLSGEDNLGCYQVRSGHRHKAAHVYRTAGSSSRVPGWLQGGLLYSRGNQAVHWRRGFQLGISLLQWVERHVGPMQTGRQAVQPRPPCHDREQLPAQLPDSSPLSLQLAVFNRGPS
jgi:hypothetical protein